MLAAERGAAVGTGVVNHRDRPPSLCPQRYHIVHWTASAWSRTLAFVGAHLVLVVDRSRASAAEFLRATPFQGASHVAAETPLLRC